jgi:CHC2 zinc finger
MISRYNHTLRRQILLLDYLQQHGWKIIRDNGGEEVAGLCPLHRDSRPSFYVNRRKQVFYCHGCGRGGGLARLIGWLEAVPPRSRCWNRLTLFMKGNWRGTKRRAPIWPHAAFRTGG